MAYEERNKAVVREQQNLIDIAVQEYGDPLALFTLIDANPERNFTIDSNLGAYVTEEIFADDQTAVQDALVTKFALEGHIVVNGGDDVIEDLRAFSSGFSLGFS